MTPNKC